MAFKLFWDNHLLFSMLSDGLKARDSQITVMMNPILGTLAASINSTQQTIQITPKAPLDTEGFLYIGSNDVGVEKIYYYYDSTNPYYLTNCTRDYDGKGSSNHILGDEIYSLPESEGQLSRFLRILEPTFDVLYTKTVSLPYLKNPDLCPADLLLYLSTERGWQDLDLTKDEAYQRKFIRFLPDIYRNKGTKDGIENLIWLVGNIKGKVYNYWDFSFLLDEIYGHPAYISVSAVTGEPDNERIYQVRVPTLNTDYSEVRKFVRYSRPACQTCEIFWTNFYDDFSVVVPYWSLGPVTTETLTSDNTLILERG